ncbi:MAG: phosphoadenylyl-sulfate reductase [Flavobacteriales bacterium]|nr:phosphoadenylyl-sulfate reductase [Flavobacteriales bacterium]|tara:strand:+ start:25974 stop:26633 length:660 start_codon:yes stop_codon:yes gene_type:complete
MRDISEIRQQIKLYQKEGKRIFATSSFQSHSIPLLHIISEIDHRIPIYYLNTGYLFPETLAFKDELAERLNLNMIGLESAVPKSQQKDENGELLFTSDPDYCCYLNKTQPLEPILASFDVWINGIRADQNANRADMKVEEKTPQGALRYHPILDWTSKDIYEYRKAHDLPPHPKEKEGYLSIGCEPCTRKMLNGDDERTSRWFGMNKVECGLHTDLIQK